MATKQKAGSKAKGSAPADFMPRACPSSLGRDGTTSVCFDSTFP